MAKEDASAEKTKYDKSLADNYVLLYNIDVPKTLFAPQLQASAIQYIIRINAANGIISKA